MNTLYYTNNGGTVSHDADSTASAWRWHNGQGEGKTPFSDSDRVSYAAALDPLVLEAGRNRLRWILVQIMVQIRTPPRLRAPHASWK